MCKRHCVFPSTCTKRMKNTNSQGATVYESIRTMLRDLYQILNGTPQEASNCVKKNMTLMSKAVFERLNLVKAYDESFANKNGGIRLEAVLFACWEEFSCADLSDPCPRTARQNIIHRAIKHITVYIAHVVINPVHLLKEFILQKGNVITDDEFYVQYVNDYENPENSCVQNMRCHRLPLLICDKQEANQLIIAIFKFVLLFNILHDDVKPLCGTGKYNKRKTRDNKGEFTPMFKEYVMRLLYEVYCRLS